MNTDTQRQWWQPEAAVRTTDFGSAGTVLINDSQVPFWGLMAFTFVMLLAPQQFVPGLGMLRPAFLSAGFAVMALIVTRSARGQPIIEFSPAIVWVTWLTAWILLTTPFSFWPGGSVGFLIDIYFKTLIIFVLVANVVNTPAKLRKICWAMVLMSVPLAITTLRNYASGAYLDGNRVAGYDSALASNPNDMALMLNLILPLGIALFLAAKKTLVKALLVALVGLLVVAIIATFSRAGFLTLCVSFFTYMWFLRNRPQRLLGPLLLILALVSVPFLPSGYYERVSTIANVEQDETGSGQERLADMKVAIGLVIQDPFVGSGVSTSMLVMNEARGPLWLKIHNVYLEYAVELGLLGLLFFLLIYRACMKSTSHVLRGYAESGQEYDSVFYLAEGIRVSLIAFMVAAFFHPVAYDFYFYYMAGLAIAAKTVYDIRRGHNAGSQAPTA